MSKELEEIKKIYYEINNELITAQPFNTSEIRHKTLNKILVELEKELINYSIMVTCNEANNPPNVVDNNQMVARVEWKLPGRFEKEIHCIDLIFGDVEVVWN